MASLSNINGLFDVHSTGAILFSTSHGTSGQILRSNGNAAPTWVAASTVIGGPYLPLTGGTLSGPLAGTSATFSGTITSGNITINGSSRALIVKSSNDQVVSSFICDGNAISTIGFKGNTGANDYNVRIGADGSSLVAYTVNTVRMTINSSGNTTFAGRVTIGTVDTVTGGHLNIGEASPTIQLFDTTNDAKLLIYTQDSSSIIGTYSNHPLAFYTDSGLTLTLNTDHSATFAGNQVTVDPASGDAILQLQSSTQTLRIDQNSIRTGTNNNLALFTNGNLNQLVLKQSNGNVGIGTSSPVGKLQVILPAYTSQDTNSQQAIFGVDSGYGVRVGYNETDNKGYINVLQPLVAWGSLILQKGGGNVGIGTDSPDYKLEVQGVISSADAGLQKATFANVGNDLVLTANADATNVTANILFKSSGAGGSSVSEKMRIDSSGRVGINTTVFPSSGFAKLVVAGGAIAARPSGVNDYFSYIKSNWASENAFEIGIEGAGTQHRFITSGNYYNGTELRFWTNDTRRVTINSIGNVGINENSPSQTLDVNGQMTHNGLVMKSGDGVYVDRYLAYTINISLIASTWVDTGIYSNSGSYQLGASGTYAVQIYSDSHGGEPYWYDAYWSGIMSWHQGSVNQNAVFEIPLTQAAHSTNSRHLELRIQNTLGSGPGTPTNNARLEVKTTASGTNTVSLSFRFRRLI